MTWIELTEGKQFSRLLYPNPVCFLCTSTAKNNAERSGAAASDCEKQQQQDEEEEDSSSLLLMSPPKRKNEKNTADDGDAILKHKNNPPTAAAAATTTTCTSQKTPADKNVMVISWLTATNNFGRFLFSMNRRRYTASRLFLDGDEDEDMIVKEQQQHLQRNDSFVLCVPTADLAELVRNVGNVTGYSGSKFPQDHYPPVTVTANNDKAIIEEASVDHSSTNNKPISKRQRNKQPRFPYGIPGLQRTAIGGGAHYSTTTTTTTTGMTNDTLFAIEGTVAHLICHLYTTLPQYDLIDPEHFLGVGVVTAAFVRAEYWNVRHNQFYPQNKGLPPYLTFLGVGKFGHVIVEPDANEDNGHNDDSTATKGEQQTG